LSASSAQSQPASCDARQHAADWFQAVSWQRWRHRCQWRQRASNVDQTVMSLGLSLIRNKFCLSLCDISRSFDYSRQTVMRCWFQTRSVQLGLYTDFAASGVRYFSSNELREDNSCTMLTTAAVSLPSSVCQGRLQEYSFGGYSPVGLRDVSLPVGLRYEVRKMNFPEAEAVCWHCLQNLTAEKRTIKIGKFRTIHSDFLPACFTVRG